MFNGDRVPSDTNMVNYILSSPFLISSINFKWICVVSILLWRLSAQNMDHCNKPVIYIILFWVWFLGFFLRKIKKQNVSS